MGIFTYFLFLIPSALVAPVLRALIQWLTENWHPASAFCWWNILRATLRAFPFALAFAPTLLIKKGLGVLLPASLYLCGAGYEWVFRGTPFDTEDGRNVTVAVTSFVLLWALLALIFFVQQSLDIDRKREDERRA